MQTVDTVRVLSMSCVQGEAAQHVPGPGPDPAALQEDGGPRGERGRAAPGLRGLAAAAQRAAQTEAAHPAQAEGRGRLRPPW